MHPGEATLLKAVCAAPDDDLPRLAYADWLDENGRPLRAEFIRVQCEFTRMAKDDPHRRSLHDRQANLLSEYRQHWLPANWSFNSHPRETWHRGFVSRVEKQTGRISREDGVSLEAVPTLESLSLMGVWITDEEFGYIPSMPNLKEFSLWGSEELTDASFTRLSEWSTLNKLDLIATGLTNSGLAHLTSLRGLESLIIEDGIETQVLTDEGLMHLARMPSLVELRIMAEMVMGRGIAVCADLPRLRKLAVGECGLTDEAINPIVN